ncbi:hypothetical protein TDB9533_03982 [Thalassocella blandensis]|nr:hypothetical protein TDB9533_03982 [Thalassocella blandensis]
MWRKCLCFLVLVLGFKNINAENYYVTSNHDKYDGVCNSHCSLRDAISQANDAPGKDTIYLQADTYFIDIQNLDDDGEIYPENNNVRGDFDILDSVEIIGQGESLTVIDGGRNDGILHVLAGNSTIRDLTLKNGYSSVESGGAGAITNLADLTVMKAIITDNENESECAALGGAIFNSGTLRLHSSVVKQNIAKDYCELTKGGAIYNRGTLIVRDSFFSHNVVDSHERSGHGGAVFNDGTADIRRSSFYLNRVQSAGQGGAIFNLGNLKLVSSTVYNNESGRAVPGGAVANGYYRSAVNETSGGELALTNVTIYGNRNYGLFSNGKTIVRNSIVVGNYYADGEHYHVDQWIQDCYQSAGEFVSDNNLFTENAKQGCGQKGAGRIPFADINQFLFEFPVVTQHTAYVPLVRNAIIRSEAEVCPRYDQIGNEAMYEGACDLGAIQYTAP